MNRVDMIEENNPLLLWHDCDSDCDYSQVKNGECECYNREMDKREEQTEQRTR